MASLCYFRAGCGALRSTPGKIARAVRSCRTKRTSFLANEPGFRVLTTKEFDNDGRLERQSHRNPDGSEFRIEFRYDASGRLTTQIYYLGEGASQSSHVYYDAQGRRQRVVAKSTEGAETVIETNAYDRQGGRSRTSYFPASEGTSQAIQLSDDGEAFLPGAVSATTTYDSSGRELGTVGHDAEHRPVQQSTRTYDVDGRLLRVKVTRLKENYPDQLKQALSKVSAEEIDALHDALHNVFGEGAVVSERTYEYDLAGRVIVQVDRSGGFNLTRQTTSYNQQGDPSKLVALSEGPSNEMNSVSVSRYDYVYDVHLNWSRRDTFLIAGNDQKGVLSSQEQRTLDYWYGLTMTTVYRRNLLSHPLFIKS